MSLATIWFCALVGMTLFVLTAWLDDCDVRQFVEPVNRYSPAEEKQLWIRILARQLAALTLMLLLDAVFVRIAEAEPAGSMQAGRFFLVMAETANLLRLQYYHRTIRETAHRSRVLQRLSGRKNRDID